MKSPVDPGASASPCRMCNCQRRDVGPPGGMGILHVRHAGNVIIPRKSAPQNCPGSCFMMWSVALRRLALIVAGAAAISTAPGARTQTPPPAQGAQTGQVASAAPTRANILRGEYGPLSRQQRPALLPPRHPRRSGQEVRLSGKNAIRFRMLQDDTRIQLDLYANLTVDRILLGQTPLKYERELNAVFVDFPETLREGPRVHHRLPLLRHAAQDRPLRRHRVSARTRRAATGSTPPAKATAPASGGPARTSGATSSRAWTSA